LCVDREWRLVASNNFQDWINHLARCALAFYDDYKSIGKYRRNRTHGRTLL